MIINIAKAFLKYLDDIRCNRNAPNRAPIVSPAPTLRIILVSIWPFLKYIKVLTIVNGKIIEIAVEWASCSFNFRKLTIAGTAIIPPPAPKRPLQKPTTAPIASSLSLLLLLLVLILIKS